MPHIRSTLLISELDRLQVEVERLERKVASGHSGLVDHILLEATRRTHATTRQALTLDLDVPFEPSRRSPARAHDDAMRIDVHAATEFWQL